VRGKDKQPGEIRRSHVWVGGTRPGNAVYVPPPWEHVRDLLGALETYIHSDNDLPPLLRIAAAHAQFKTIHPYLDGNGRIGRLLIALLLTHWRVLDAPLLYLSVFLKEHQAEYYDQLGSIRRSGTWGDWFRFFLEGTKQVTTTAAATASALNRQVNNDRKILLSAESITVSAIQLFEALPKHPVISMPLVTRILSTSKPTASKAIDLLIKQGILTEIGDRKRDRIYKYDKYLQILD